MHCRSCLSFNWLIRWKRMCLLVLILCLVQHNTSINIKFSNIMYSASITRVIHFQTILYDLNCSFFHEFLIDVERYYRSISAIGEIWLVLDLKRNGIQRELNYSIRLIITFVWETTQNNGIGAIIPVFETSKFQLTSQTWIIIQILNVCMILRT